MGKMRQVYIVTVLAALILLFLIPRTGGKVSDNREIQPVRQQINRSAMESEPSTVGVKAEINYVLPADWTEESPSSSMRLAQFKIPGIDGGEAIELVVFDRIGGSVDQNLERWAGQFKIPEGEEKKELVRSQETKNGLNITFASVYGTYSVSGSGMAFSGVDKPNYKMFAAIIESSVGNYYFKAIGPILAIDNRFDELKEFVRTVEIE
jgi:hypothetical protein